jgi:peptidoglycan/xylan/chitin deacetylase (PgdA/CDA1 family)
MLVDFSSSTMERTTIDLNRAEKAVFSITGEPPSGYQPRTLRSQNGGRTAYLPIFPTNHKSPRDRLLFTHVPGNYFLVDEG